MIDKNDVLHWTCQTDDGVTEFCNQPFSGIAILGGEGCPDLAGIYSCGSDEPQ
ncbi:hypothetical protein J6T66_02285 [bacterium]|nr:hypothetical protein [bacterium]